ncbi:MAG: small multi-drug export protein [Phycisphaeraceae bacterium]|nr:small multi-drug export protein [Phycisphaeraceae bacterium]
MSDDKSSSLESAAAQDRPDLPPDPPLKEQYPAVWLGTLIGPFILTGLVLLTIWMIHGHDYLVRLVGVAVATFFFFGRFVILLGRQRDQIDPAGIGEDLEADYEATAGFSPQFLMMMVLYMDLMVATLVSCHLRVLFRLPWLGPAIRELVNDGRFILRAHPWLRKMTFVGIVGLVTFPLASTGSIGGSVFGRLLGMSRLATFLGVVVGSVIGCTIMYLGADLINRHLDRDDPWMQYGGIAVIALIIVILNHRYRRMKSQYLARDQQTP